LSQKRRPTHDRGRPVTSSDHFSGVASAYALRRPHYPEELFAFLAAEAAQHDLAWDCGAGSGQASLPLTRFFHRVVATDPSAAMLKEAPRHSFVEYRTTLAHARGLDPETVDLVTVAQALHWIDLEPFYAEVDRVLRPGGLLAVWTYGNQRLENPEIDEVLHRFYHEVVGPFWPSGRRHVEAGYRGLPFPFREIPTPTFQMQEQWTLAELLGYIGTWSASQRFRDAKGYDPAVSLAAELQQAWGEPGSTRRILWPIAMRLGCRAGVST
jgi:ubiquinone/menaquinone biosynthesis C-methylase UbiE